MLKKLVLIDIKSEFWSTAAHLYVEADSFWLQYLTGLWITGAYFSESVT